jgi:hypothetical protein
MKMPRGIFITYACAIVFLSVVGMKVAFATFILEPVTESVIDVSFVSVLKNPSFPAYCNNDYRSEQPGGIHLFQSIATTVTATYLFKRCDCEYRQ